MSLEILMNVTPQETRVALVENGVLQDIYIERTRKRGLVGNIYKGRVCRVLPGMQAAFVNIGLERTAFLHASDALPATEGDSIEIKKTSENISTLLHNGQEILVQVIKDPIGGKGARLNMQVAIPSRYLVFMPTLPHIGVSQRIEDAMERQRLKDLVQSIAGESNAGYILRTAAEGVAEEDLRADIDLLYRLWLSIEQRAKNAPAQTIIHEDLPLAMRTLRDLTRGDIEKLRIDSRDTYQRTQQFAEQFMPEMMMRIEHYSGERPIFDLYSVEDEIQKALERKVPLKSGGHIVIDQTEALTTVDVNTGAFVGHQNLEETLFKTNLEAALTIARQLRLRNLGGIIIIDFIDMEDPEHRRQVLRALEKALERDHAKTHISGVSALGLVQMTRKRTRESLGHLLCEPCQICKGSGSLKTAETVCYEIFREILRSARQFDAQRYLLLASQEIVDLLLDEESTSLGELEEFIGKPITLQVESVYTQEQFDVVLT